MDRDLWPVIIRDCVSSRVKTNSDPMLWTLGDYFFRDFCLEWTALNPFSGVCIHSEYLKKQQHPDCGVVSVHFVMLRFPRVRSCWLLVVNLHYHYTHKSWIFGKFSATDLDFIPTPNTPQSFLLLRHRPSGIKCCRSWATLLWHCSSEQAHTVPASHPSIVWSRDVLKARVQGLHTCILWRCGVIAKCQM